MSFISALIAPLVVNAAKDYFFDEDDIGDENQKSELTSREGSTYSTSEEGSNIGTKYIDAFTTKEEKNRLVEILQGIQPTLDSLINVVNVNPHVGDENPPTDASTQNIIDKILNDQLYFRLARKKGLKGQEAYPVYWWHQKYPNTSGMKDIGEYVKLGRGEEGLRGYGGYHMSAYEGKALDETTHKYKRQSSWAEPILKGGFDPSAPDTLFKFIPDPYLYETSKEDIAETILHELIHASGPLKSIRNKESKGPVHPSADEGTVGDQAHYRQIEDAMIEALKQQGTWEELLEMMPTNVQDRMFRWPSFRINSK